MKNIAIRQVVSEWMSSFSQNSDNEFNLLFLQIIKDVGLAISLYEVVSIGEQRALFVFAPSPYDTLPEVYPGDGGAHVKVAFKLVVFRYDCLYYFFLKIKKPHLWKRQSLCWRDLARNHIIM